MNRMKDLIFSLHAVLAPSLHFDHEVFRSRRFNVMPLTLVVHVSF